jgi:general secretion pathway protein J
MNRQARGFTLLEVLLATVLLALLIAGAYGGLRASAHAMRAGEATIDRTDRLRTAQEFVRRQLSHILPLTYAHDDGTGRNYVFEGTDRFMRFVAPMPGYLSHGGPYVQTLELVPGKDGLQLQFTDRMLNGYDEKSSAADDPVVLIDHIASGQFAYRALDDQGNLEDWNGNWREPEITPLMIRIDLTMRPDAQISWPTLDVSLRLDAGARQMRVPRLMPAIPGQ